MNPKSDEMNEELEFLTRFYPDMAETAAFALSWAQAAPDPVERVLNAVHNGRIPTRCNCDYEDCPGWVMTSISEFGDILRAVSNEGCRTYWGSHGCRAPRGHPGPHACGCCECVNHGRDHAANGCVGRPPYYGPDTKFFGEDTA